MPHNRLECAGRMRERGFRVTPQRLLLLDAICEGREHTTFDQIYDRMKTKAPGINRATVYRSLNFLRKLGLIYAAEIGGHTVYEIADQPHYHLICCDCGAVDDLADYHFEDLAAHLLKEYGFKADLDHLAITGICSKCLQASES